MRESEWGATWHALRRILGSKWSLHLLRLLHGRSYGFNELKREVDGLTATMLSRRLKELRCHGLVERTVEDSTPPRTTYRLTDAGVRFAELLEEMEALTTVVPDGDRDAADQFGCDDPELICATGGEEICVTVSEPTE